MKKTILNLCILLSLPSMAFGLAKEFGIGYGGVAFPQTSTTMNFNPALITAQGNRYDAGLALEYFWGRAKIKNSDNDSFNQSASYHRRYLPFGAIGYCQQYKDTNFYIGFSTDSVRSAANSLNKTLVAIGTSHQASEAINPIFVPTLGWKINECHAVGIGVPFFIGRFRINGLQNLEQVSASPEHVTNKGYDYAFAWGLRFGWLWHVTPCFDFGLSANTPQLGTTSFRKYRGLIARRGKFEISPEVKAGIAYHYEKFSFVFDLQYTIYNASRTLHNSPTSPHLFGTKKGPGFGWNNLLNPVVGVVYRYDEAITLRVGYGDRLPPWTRHSNTVPNYINPFFTLKNYYTCGATWATACGTEFTFAYLFGYRGVRGDREASLANGRMNTQLGTHTFFIEFGKVMF